MIGIAVALGLGLLALVFVLYPLWQREGTRFSPTRVGEGDDPHRAQLVRLPGKGRDDVRPVLTPYREQPLSSSVDSESEQTARLALREIELDYQLGNIEDTDYAALRERYLQRAVVALKSRSAERDLDEEIEAQLQLLKKQKRERGMHEQADR